jgi:hypothetical protein
MLRFLIPAFLAALIEMLLGYAGSKTEGAGVACDQKHPLLIILR